MKNLIKQAYDLLEQQGETLSGDVHIIQIEENLGEERYRIYHSDGYCVDVQREEICDPKDYKSEKDEYQDLQPDGCIYTYYAEWDDFRNIESPKKLLYLVKKWISECL